MNIEIESTETITEVDGVPVRLWRGWTESGIPCAVFVHRIAVLHTEDSSQFDNELEKQLPPAEAGSLREALEKWRSTLPHVPYRGEAEHPDNYDGPCICDSCIEDGLR